MKDSNPEHKEEAKEPVGRPPLFSTHEELEKMGKEYFALFEETAAPEERKARGIEVYENRPTITGLCLFLGFESRDAFYRYEKKPEFQYTIKALRTKIENVYEQYLTTKGAAGAIFALKNFQWTDRQEIDHTSGGEKINQMPEIKVYNTAPPLAGSEDSVDVPNKMPVIQQSETGKTE